MQELQSERRPRPAAIAAGAAIVAITAGVLWILLAKPASPDGITGMPVLLPSPSEQTTHRAAQSDEVPRPRSQDGGAAGVDRPPKIAVQVFDTQEGLCPATFDVSVNVYVVRGRVDSGTVALSVPPEDILRRRPLLGIAGDWSALISSVPTNRTASLRILVEGPRGTTEEVHDITHECPGKILNTDELVDAEKDRAAGRPPKGTAPDGTVGKSAAPLFDLPEIKEFDPPEIKFDFGSGRGSATGSDSGSGAGGGSAPSPGSGRSPSAAAP